MAFSPAHQDLRQMLGTLRSAGAEGVFDPHPQVRQFITIAREPGIMANGLGELLTQYLNREAPSESWRCMDRELVQNVAEELHLPTDMIESLERTSRTWIADFLSGLGRSDPNKPSETKVFRRVMEWMRSLAQAGHVVLIGMGGALMTRDLLGGIHLQLVAPVEWRVKKVAQLRNISEIRAADEVALLDHDREGFYRKFWPTQPLRPDIYHLTLNAGFMTDAQMCDVVMTFIRSLKTAARA